jgi:hypothetical protein
MANPSHPPSFAEKQKNLITMDNFREIFIQGEGDIPLSQF